MVAVRMRTAGQPALRRKIFSDGPGINMPGAAACAVDSAQAAAACHADVAHAIGRRGFDLSLHVCRTRIRRTDAGFHSSLHVSAYRPASGVPTGSALVPPASVHSPITAVMMLPAAARPCARVLRADGVSGMDIAERNGVAAVLPTSSSGLPARCETLLIASDRGPAAMRVSADCQTGRHMSYNAPADSCARVICQSALHRGGGHRQRSPVVEQTKLAKNCVSTQNRRHGREQ